MDDLDALATAMAKRAYQAFQGGGLTLSQALDAAFDAVNPQKKAAVTALVVKRLFGLADDPPVPKRQGDAVRAAD